jgi:lysozyme family protein
MADYRRLIPFIKRWEGGYCEVKGDKGGVTNEGITLATFRHYYGEESTKDNLKNMTESQWEHIYKIGFWDKWRADEIGSMRVAAMLVDWVWASGSWGIIIPQRVLGLKQDGVVGIKTLSAVNNSEPITLFAKLYKARKEFYEGIVARQPSQRKFLAGWLNRLNSLAKSF